MAFVRAKKINGKDRHYLVESRRINGEVRQKVLAYLGEGDTVQGAIDLCRDEIERKRYYESMFRQRAEDARARVHPVWIEENDGVIPEGKRPGRRLFYNPCRRYWLNTRSADQLQRRIDQLQARVDKLEGYVT